jgi:DNA-binding HxlR family transcriptional regulator
LTAYAVLIKTINNAGTDSSTGIDERYFPAGKHKTDMISRYIENANFEDTGFSYTLSLISGKYKMVILYCLMEYQPVRFNELKRYLKNISDKTLSSNLKELEQDRLIIRKEYPQIPPKVEYRLSERGKSLMKVLDKLCVWGEQNRD